MHGARSAGSCTVHRNYRVSCLQTKHRPFKSSDLVLTSPNAQSGAQAGLNLQFPPLDGWTCNLLSTYTASLNNGKELKTVRYIAARAGDAGGRAPRSA